jgi:endonuclease YncB( thermonuclease family)
MRNTRAGRAAPRGVLWLAAASVAGALGLTQYVLTLHKPAADIVELVRVSDGDTIVVKDVDGRQVKVRLIGVDAPELGTAASFRCALFCAEQLEAAGSIRIEPEPTKPVDKYGRTLAWVWYEGGGSDEKLLNEEVIDAGYAEIFPGTSKQVKYWERLH